MDYYVAQLWKPRASWLALSRDERTTFLDERVSPKLASMRADGTEMLACAINDLAGATASGYRYLAVWRLADKAAAELLVEQIEATGFFEHFEEINAGGTSIPIPQIHDDMAGL